MQIDSLAILRPHGLPADASLFLAIQNSSLINKETLPEIPFMTPKETRFPGDDRRSILQVYTNILR